jgi:hypothetical protein
VSGVSETVPGNTGRRELRSGPEAIGKCADSDRNIRKALQESGGDQGRADRAELRGKKGRNHRTECHYG